MAFKRAIFLSGLAFVAFQAASFPQDAVLGFDAPAEVLGPPGGTVEFEAFATITPGPGTQVTGWSLSLTADGAEITSVTTEGLRLLERPFFSATHLAVHKDDPGRKGAICALLGIGYPRAHQALPFTLPTPVLRLGLVAATPAAGERRTVTLRFEDGFRLPGAQPTQNLLTVEFGNVLVPATSALTVEIRGREGALFRRGDANADGELSLSDPIFGFNHLFRGGTEPTCQWSLDANDDGELNLTDPIYLILFLFRGGQPPPPPAEGCGFDTTDDALGCRSFAPCA